MGLSRSEEETRALGAALAPRTDPGEVVVLEGELGAGKTEFVRGLVAGLGGNGEEVVSPTYLGCLPYETAEGLVLHLDLYRDDDTSRLAALLAEAAEQEPRLVAVEWAGARPDGAWLVHLADGPGARERLVEVEAP